MNNLLREMAYEKQNLKYFHIISGLYVLGILTSLTVSARLIPFHIPIINFDIYLTAGTWTIPFTFFIQDIATEVYGRAKSRQIVYFSIPVVIIYIFYLKLTTLFPLPNITNVVDSYNIVFNALPRHLLALLVAITMGILINNIVLSKLKSLFKGKYLPLRFIGSTLVGEAVLQVVGTSIAWVGSLQFSSEILPFIIFSYLYKVTFEAVLTPVNIYACRWLKNAEGIDIYED